MTKPSAISYRIRLADPAAHLFEIECQIPHPDPQGQLISLPNWIPGSYMIRDFARHIVQIQADSDDQPLKLYKRTKNRWQCAPCKRAIRLRYQVYAWDLSVRGAHFDQNHAFFNATSVFLCVEGQEQAPCQIDIDPGEAPKDWIIATALDAENSDQQGQYGRYLAQDYDHLLDSPVEIGPLTVANFDACGSPHQLAIQGRLYPDSDIARLVRDLKRLCEHHIRLFGEPAPMARYTFLLSVVGDGYGGLEHRASSANLCKRDDLPRTHQAPISDGYRQLLGLLSHEYFHSWNVKRIKPSAFSPYRLEQETPTQLLWAFEGITSYYDDLSLRRTGLIDTPSYLQLLERSITRLRRGSGRQKQSVLESSFDAWTKFYKQDENAANAIVSYYTKGSLIALGLDLTLRQLSDDQLSLDTLMRRLWQHHGLTEEGIDEDTDQGKDQIQEHALALVKEQLDDPQAVSQLKQFFDQSLRSTAELPLEQWFAQQGILLQWRARQGQQDQGGATHGDHPLPRPQLGAIIAADNKGGALLKSVQDHSDARAAGLSAGDRIIAVDALHIDHNTLESRIASYAIGNTLQISAFRRDELFHTSLTLSEPPNDTAWLKPMNQPEPEQQARQNSWLGTRD